jgi:Carboxypeptidase regulatory-like domain
MKLLKLSFPALLLIPMLLGGPQVAVGQNVYATVHGTVTDASGALVPGATVTALNTSTGITSQAVTDTKGYYVFAQLQTGGPYTISIEKSGFQTFKTTDLSLASNDNREISAKLAVGAGSQTIQVEASSVQVETSDTQLKTDINSSEIVSLPLLARNAVALQKTAPGVVEASDRFGTFSTNGSQTPQNGFLVDGVDVNDGPLQTAGVTPNPDAIGELNIITSTLNPEYNRNSGAIVSEELKTGTNRFHGSGFWFYRDTFLDNPYYFSGGKRPPYHQNLYGGTLGGPVLKDKLFFFLAYQGYRNAVSSVDNTKVPDADQLAGNFSDDIANGVVSGKTLPFAVGSCTAGETWANCFASNGGMFSPANYNPIAAKMLQQFVPASNATIGGAPYYRFFAATTNGDDQGIIRADWHPTANDAIWGSSIFESHPDNETIPFTGATLPGFPQNDARHIKIFNGSFTHTFSPTMVNELRAGYFRFYYAAVEPADVVTPSSYGFDITPQSPSAGLPYIGINGYFHLGFSTNGPQPRNDQNYDYQDNFTWIKGAHNMKFGAHIERFVVSNPFYGNNNGSFGYGGSGSYTSGDQLLDFFLGIPDTYSQGSGGWINAAAWEYYFYAQDNWKISSTLTLNYGLSWDTETPNRMIQYGKLGVTCFNVGGNNTSQVFKNGPPGMTWPGDAGCNDSGGPTTKWGHLGPRVGLAWSPSSGPSMLVGSNGTHDFAVRAGFGIYYNRDQEEGQLQNLSAPPFGLTSSGAADAGLSPGFASPYTDVAARGSANNPFPFTNPGAGATINWGNYGPLELNEFDRGYTPPLIYNFNLNVQRQLPGSMVLTAGYVGSLGRHLIFVYDGDPITTAGHAACEANPDCVANSYGIHIFYPQYTVQPALNPGTGSPWYGGVGVQASYGAANYNALQISLAKASTHGLMFNLAYTYSHGLDNASGLESSGFNGRGYNWVPGYQYLSYGDSDFDARHRFVALYVYEIPIGNLRSNTIARETLGGWRVSGITAFQTGFPVTLMQTSGWNSLWCDAYYYYYCADSPQTSTFNVKTMNPRGATNEWFDPSNFSSEPIGTFGNTKRNYFHGPGYNYTNFELAKDIPIHESMFIELQLEAFNLFNHANFDQPDGNFSDGPGSFAVISNVIQPVNNGDPQPGRCVQLAAKFYF